MSYTNSPCTYFPDGRVRTDENLDLKGEYTTPEFNRIAGDMLAIGYYPGLSGRFMRYACKGCQLCYPLRYDLSKLNFTREQNALLETQEFFRDSRLGFLPGAEQQAHEEVFVRYMTARHSVSHFMPQPRAAFGGYVSANGRQKVRVLEWLRDKPVYGKTPSVLGGLIYSEFGRNVFGHCYYFDVSDEVMKQQPGKTLLAAFLVHAKAKTYAHAYVGAWIPHFGRFAPKSTFKPYELLIGDEWQSFSDTSQPFSDSARQAQHQPQPHMKPRGMP